MPETLPDNNPHKRDAASASEALSATVVMPEVRINPKDLAFRVKMLDQAICRVEDTYQGYCVQSLRQHWTNLELLLHGGS
jgi:hypothetical protein